MEKSALSITLLCDVMLDESLGNAFDRYVLVHKKLRYITNRKYRQWFYQLCTEIGNFVTSNEDDHLFGNTIPIDFFTDLCTDAVHKTTMMYHGLKNTTSRVIYLPGSIDPWNGLGLIEPKLDDSISIFIEVLFCGYTFFNLGQSGELAKKLKNS
ncbi:hypothetical protein QTP88_000397 [Uroleucon formosanum]